MNLLHYNFRKSPTCFGQTFGHLRGGIFMNNVIQTQQSQCKNIKY
jgi:hypothetical protein